MSGWDLDSGSNGGGQEVDFTKFPVGVTKIRVVDVAPHQRWTHWMPQFRRSVNCPGRGCPIDEIRRQEKANGVPYSYNMTKRFALQIINRETGKLEIMEQGKTFMEDLRDLMNDLREDGKSLSDVDIKVRRRGTDANDTTYRLDIDEEYPLSDNDKKLAENKLDLNEYFKPHTPEQIMKLLEVRAETPDGYREAWNNIMKDGEEPIGEEIEIR